MRRALGAALLVAGLCARDAAAGGAPGAPADVFIAERPRALVLFDMYQQRLGAGGDSLILPFSPIIILRAHDVMGDGFTPCAAVEIGGAMYYVQEDASGKMSSTAPEGAAILLHGATIEGDTVVLLAGPALRLRAPIGKGESSLEPGTRALRIFESKGEAYVRIVSAAAPFGWVPLSGAGRGTSWRSVPVAAEENVTPEEILRRVRSVADGASRTLRRIYASLAPRGGEVPFFRVTRSGREVSCVVEPASLEGEFSGSLLAMLPPLERALGGTGIRPVMSGNAIRILLP